MEKFYTKEEVKELIRKAVYGTVGDESFLNDWFIENGLTVKIEENIILKQKLDL